MLQIAFGLSCINRTSVLKWHKRFKEDRESLKDDVRCGRCKEVNTPELMRFPRKRPALFLSGQWHFHQDNAPVHNYIFVTDYLTKICVKTVLQPFYSTDLPPCAFRLFPKLRGCRYETIEEMKRLWRRSLTRSHQMIKWGLPEVVGTVQAHCNWGDYFEGV